MAKNKMKYNSLRLLLSLYIMIHYQVLAKEWAIDYTQSKISFTGMHANAEFTGEFPKFTASISYDSESLEQTLASFIIDMHSTTVSDSYYSTTLQTKDWFNTNKYAQAYFELLSLTKAKTENTYVIKGKLKIKDRVKIITIPASINQENDRVFLLANFHLNRLDFAIGANADPNSEWVDNRVNIRVYLEAMNNQ